MPKSVYIHIPFCKNKCKYCSFVSFPLASQYQSVNMLKSYVEALLKEIDYKYKGESIETLYIGGGTPSIMPAELLKQIVNKFSFVHNPEITVEVNPDSVNKEYFIELKKIGFNRISIGSQTFDDNILKNIGRIHNSAQIADAVYCAKSAGFDNISLDLIYGLPAQSLQGLKIDIDKIFSLDVQHISTYGLKIEENSYFGKHYPENLPDDDMQADMYLLINQEFGKADFHRYEISNFSKIGFESRHNLNYWNNDEYYGFGVSAHGYTDGMRYANSSKFRRYTENPLFAESKRKLTKQEKLEEEIFLGFRKAAGIDKEKIKYKFNVDFEKKYAKILKKYSNYIEKNDTGYFFNIDGVLLSNIILAEFIS